ncbi:MAG: Holliday junction branch migration protein RuvA [Clostridia bacterium]|nr:Holliday junction branch migration protein RuvA [Clostridia bacterium]
MFYSLTGELIKKGTGFAVIECGGVGFFCNTSNTTLYDISGEKKVTLFTHLNVREDAMDLFGFSTETELQWFRMLISVNGVGPKAALAILSELTPDRLALAISANDVKMIKAAPGIGPKIAQRIILDLKDKVSAYATDNGIEDIAKISAAKDMPNVSEAVAALTMLGYSQADASVAVSQIDPSLSVEDIIRQGLKILSKQ